MKPEDVLDWAVVIALAAIILASAAHAIATMFGWTPPA